MATFAINETARREQYVSTGQATYNFNFQVNVADELLVYVNDTAQTLSVQYNATLNADGTGSITFIDNSGGGGTNYTPSSGDYVTIIGDLALSRTTTLNTAADITTTNLDTEFDNTVIRQQQIKEITDRALQLKPSTPRTVTGSGTSGPIYWPYDATPSNNASRVISYDSNGTGLELGPTTANLNTLASIVSDISTVASVSSDVSTVASIGSSDISAVAGKATEIGLLGNADTIADMALLGNADVIADMALLATTDVIADLNTLATTDIVNDLNQLATTDFVSDLNAVEGIKANITTTANNIAGINSFAERYRVGSSDPTTSLDAGDLNFNTSSNELKYFDGSNWNAVAAQDQNVKVTGSDTSGGVLNDKLAVSGSLSKTVTNPGSNETLTLSVQVPEVYGFSVNSNGNLIVTTTNGGADSISSTDYNNFDDVLFSANGFTFSINSSGNLIATI